MDREISSTTQYKPVTVDVPEDRLAEFHAFFARFLAGPRRRDRAGRHGRPHGGRHGQGHRCAGRSETSEPSEPTPAPTVV
jgi:hypothetical protein